MNLAYYPTSVSKYCSLLANLSYGFYGMFSGSIIVFLKGNFNYCVMFDGTFTLLALFLFFYYIQNIKPHEDTLE